MPRGRIERGPSPECRQYPQTRKAQPAILLLGHRNVAHPLGAWEPECRQESVHSGILIRRLEPSRMRTTKIVYWEEDGSWIGYLQEFPDYWTQGDTWEDLESHLRDLYADLTSGDLLGIRRVADIAVA